MQKGNKLWEGNFFSTDTVHLAIYLPQKNLQVTRFCT